MGKRPSPIVFAQSQSLRKCGINLKLFTINQKGVIGYGRECHRLSNFLRRNNFDIIHAHYALTAIVSLVARNKEKLVVSFMGDDIVGTNRKDGSVTSISRVFAFINSVLAKYFFDHSIVKSIEMLKMINTDKVSLIPNGVDLDLFCPKDKLVARDKLSLNPSSKIILFVSNPSRIEKNYNLAKTAVTRINIPDTILLTISDVSQRELVNYYNAADAIILTSFHEGSPNVIKEAMACNCPIVSTDVGDVKWVIGKTNGCFVASFDADDFAKKIEHAINYSLLNGRTNGRDRIQEIGLDATSITKKIINIYESLK
jgi:teichuronic acid biosynthesis glycosyltransferase TuaC